MNSLIFIDFSLNSSELKIFSSNLKSNFQIIYNAQVTWHNLERPIDRNR